MRRDSRRPIARPLLLALAALGTAPLARAGFNVPYAPPFHGAPCTEYSGFESFVHADTLPNPPDDPATTSLDTTIAQLVPGGVITGAGNLDHLTLPPQYRLADSVPADLQEVSFHVCILLNQFDWTSVVLRYVDGGGTTRSIAPSSQQQLVFLMGREERAIHWDLTAVSDVVTTYWIDFDAQLSFTTLDAVQLETRYACAPYVVSCAGDGSGAACPCANTGAAGRGCDNSFATGGGALTAAGTAQVGADTLVLSVAQLPPSTTVLFFQGTDLVASGAGAAFGDGLRCAAGTVVRIGTKATSGGAASFGHGVGSDPDVSVRGAVPGGALRQYQAWYRNSASFCTASPFNLTNSIAVQW